MHVRDLNYQLKQICRHNRDGSRSTQANRERMLTLIANQLHQLGFRQLQATSLKPKHVEALVQHWQQKGIAPATIKNRMAALRWWAEKVDKRNVIARDNSHYGIPSRAFVAQGSSKALSLPEQSLAKVRDLWVRISLELQRAFGLRREEAIKFQPKFADRDDHLELKATWCKGGRSRTVPVRSESQREVLRRAHELAKGGSLIPSDRSYAQQLRIYERQVSNAGLSRMHGLRHTYAQERYEELTGWECPAAGGPSSEELTPEQREIDREARMTITEELGHGREQITIVYLGRSKPYLSRNRYFVNVEEVTILDLTMSSMYSCVDENDSGHFPKRRCRQDDLVDLVGGRGGA